MTKQTRVPLLSSQSSDGVWHSFYTLCIAAALLLVPLFSGNVLDFSYTLGALVGLVINPDLDQDGLTIAETIFTKIPTPAVRGKGVVRAVRWLVRVAIKGVGTTLTGIWMSVWGIYAVIMPHRHFLSHFPIVGTVGRIIYLIAVLIVFRDVTGADYTISTQVFYRACVGLACADAGHWLRDIGILNGGQSNK